MCGLNLKIKKGETLVVLGRSGCGKSVMLKILLGLMPADEGQIYVDGEEISQLQGKRPSSHRQKMGMLFRALLYSTR